MSMYEVTTDDLHLTQQQVADFREAFGLFDRSGKGSITADDLKAVLQSLGQNPSEDELRDMIREVDDDESGTIEFPEFLKLMVRKMKAPDNEAELTDALRVFDLDNNGFISAEHLRHVLTNYGEVLNTTEIDTLICAASIDGQIKYVEFVKSMSR